VRIHHLALRTSNLAGLEHFYTVVLGLRVLRHEQGRSVWLDAAGTILMLERREENEPAPDPTSMDLVCFAMAPEDHRPIVDRLASANVAIEGQTAYTIYFRDPDGRRIGMSSYPVALAPHS
jgi:catechol 2,3-dioxygenase-like lactoylglutathione lyase family enzyme